MNEETAHPSPSRVHAFRLVTYSYLMALTAGGATLALAPIEDPLVRTLAADVVATLVIFGWSVAYDNSSFYDAYWSVIPPLVAFYWWTLPSSDAPGIRALGILLVLGIWGARLTWNWARGWTGLAHEDWRYIDFRKRFPRAYWLVSFGGIHFFPTLIVFAALVAAFPALVGGGRPLGPIDALALAVGLGGIAFEWLADAQLRAFVVGPKQPGQTLRTGLWRYSRHPNYLGEMMIWWSLWLFGLAADPEWAKWGLLGPVAMTAMFMGVSIPLLEKRSLERRDDYQRVIDETSKLIPLPPRRVDN